MFAHRFRRFEFVGHQRGTTVMAFVLLPSTAAGASAIYRTAYMTAFKTVEKRVQRRRQVRAAQFVSPN